MNAKFHAYAAVMVIGQTGAGLALITALAIGAQKMPQPHLLFLVVMALCMSASALWLQRKNQHYPPLIQNSQHLLCSILLGISLAAALWPLLGFAHTSWLILAGMGLRWYLYGAETFFLHRADRNKEPSPSAATHSRRWVTLVTGALIPLIILFGSSPQRWLWISFILTCFCQWTIASERCHHCAQAFGSSG